MHSYCWYLLLRIEVCFTNVDHVIRRFEQLIQFCIQIIYFVKLIF